MMAIFTGSVPLISYTRSRSFVVMPTNAVEMYDPDVYGKGVVDRLDIDGGQP